MNLYIDSNIYLDYFRQSGEELTSLRALKKLLTAKTKKGKKLSLLIPEQTEQEYARNRESIVAETRKTLLSQKLTFNPASPALKDRKEVKQIQSSLRKIKNLSEKLLEEYDSETEKEMTESDRLIQEIFSLGIKIEESPEIIQKAHTRHLKGNPPRKNDNSFGDAIIWETLLEEAQSDSLTIITKDGDFIHELKGKKVLKSYLQKEWEKRSKKKIKLFTSLGEFVTSFDKRVRIKKKIIEQEKIGISDQQPFFGFPHSISSIPFYSQSLIDDPAPVSTFITGAPDTMRTSFRIGPSDNVRYCPFCGKEIIFPLSSTYYLQVTHTKRSFRCSNCGRSFET